MVADFKSNQQAGLAGLCKGTEINDSASEDNRLLESGSFDSYNTNAQASEDDQQLPGQPVELKEIFPGMAEIQALAKKVRGQIFDFFRRTLRSIIEIGNYLKKIESEVKDVFGSKEGKARFKQWLSSPEGVGSPEVALSMMEITSWYFDLEPEMQRLIINKTETWSFAALKKLRGLSHELIKQLVKEEKQTVESIERAIATSLADELAPLPAEGGDRPVTNSDWSSLRKNFSLRPKHIKVLKHKAKNLASLSAETAPVVKVSHVNEAIAQCKEDPEILSKPAKKAKKNKTDNSTPAESPLQDNSDKAITELISSAIAPDMEKEPAANSETIAQLQQALAEKNNTQAAQEEQINSAITGEQEKAALRLRSGTTALRDHCAQGPPVEGMYTQEQLDEAIARDREKRKNYVYTEEDVKEEVAYACDELRSKMYTNEQVENEIEYALSKQFATLTEKMYTEEQMQALLAEPRAEVLSNVDTPDAEKLASYERTLAQRDREIVSLEEQKTAALAEARTYYEQLKANRAVEQASSNRMEKMARELGYKLELLENQLAEKNIQIASLEKQTTAAAPEVIASLQRALAEKDQAIASMSEQTAAAVDQARAEEREKTESLMAEQITSLQQTVAELQRALAEKDQALASLEEQNANSVASGSPLMEKEREAALSQARAEEREKMALVMASKLESLQKELAEKNQALASSSEEKAAAVAEARADEQAVAWMDIEVLQKEIKGLKAANHSLQTTKEQLATASGQIEELKSQLADTKKEHLMRTKLLEGDLNSVVKSNHGYLEMIDMLESGNLSMRHENRSLKDELAGYKNIEKMLQENYAKIKKAERLQTENETLKENLQGQKDQSVLLASRVNQLSRALDEVSYMQRTLANLKIPGFQSNGEKYVSPLDGQTYQGIKGLAKFFQDLVNNNFNLGTT